MASPRTNSSQSDEESKSVGRKAQWSMAELFQQVSAASGSTASEPEEAQRISEMPIDSTESLRRKGETETAPSIARQPDEPRHISETAAGSIHQADEIESPPAVSPEKAEAQYISEAPVDSIESMHGAVEIQSPTAVDAFGEPALPVSPAQTSYPLDSFDEESEGFPEYEVETHGAPVEESHSSTPITEHHSQSQVNNQSVRRKEDNARFVADLVAQARALRDDNTPGLLDPGRTSGRFLSIGSRNPTTENLNGDVASDASKSAVPTPYESSIRMKAIPMLDHSEEERKSLKRREMVNLHGTQITTISCVVTIVSVIMTFWLSTKNEHLTAQIGTALNQDEVDHTQSLLNTALKDFPNDPRFHFLKGRLLAKEGKMEQALTEYLIATDPARGQPNNLEFVEWRGKAYMFVGDNEKALADFNQVLASAPKNARCYADRALVLMRLGKIDDAVSDAKRAVELDPANQSNHVKLATVYGVAQKYKEATAEWTAIIAAEPQNAAAYAGRANAEYSDGQSKAAFDDLEKSLQIHPSGQAYFNRGVLRRLQHNTPAAIEDFTSAIKLEPTQTAFLAERAKAYKDAGDLKSAMKDYAEIDKVANAASKDVLLDRSAAEIDAGKFRQAADDLAKVVQHNQNDMSLRLKHAETCVRAQQYSNAVDEYNYLIKSDPNNPMYYVKRALVFAKQNHSEDASRDLETALRLNSHYADAYFARAMMSADAGSYDAASFDLVRVLKLEPNNAAAKQKLRELAIHKERSASHEAGPQVFKFKTSGDPVADAYQLIKMRQPQSAITRLTAVIKNDPDNAQARKYLAYASMDIGQPDAAAQQFQASDRLEPLSLDDNRMYAKALIACGRKQQAALPMSRILVKVPGDLSTRMELIRLYWFLGMRTEANNLYNEGVDISPRDAGALRGLMKTLNESGPSNGPSTKPAPHINIQG